MTGTVDEVGQRFRDLGAMGCTDIIVRDLIEDQPGVPGSMARLGAVRSALGR